MTSIRKGIKKALPVEAKRFQSRAEVEEFERAYGEAASPWAGEFPINQLQLPAWLEEFESEPFQGFTEFDEVGQSDNELDFWLPPWIDKLVPASALTPPAPPFWVTSLLPKLKSKGGILPLDLLIGWIATESSGRIATTTPQGEKGFFQLNPDEMVTFKLNPSLVASDTDYSLNAGIKAANYYSNHTQKRLGLQPGTDLFWRVVRLMAAFGIGDATRLIEEMIKQGARPATWDDVRNYAAANGDRLVGAILKRNPARFIAQVDETFDLGPKLVKQYEAHKQYRLQQQQNQKSGAIKPELFLGGLGETDLFFEAEPFHSYAEFDEMEFDSELADDSFRYRRDPYARSEETGIQQMIETGKMSQDCVTLWGDFCKAVKEWRRTASAVENKKWVINDEEFKLKKWRCADASIRLPDTVKRICKEVSDKVERLKAELRLAEAEHQQAVTVYRDIVNRLAKECPKLNPNTLVCPA